jgi:hypothetical protein
MRIAPRDIFTEAKLLKCVAHIVEKIDAGDAGGLRFVVPANNVVEGQFTDFDSSDDTMVTPYGAFYNDGTDESYTGKVSRGAKSAFPLHMEDENFGFYEALDDNGDIDRELRDVIGDDNQPAQRDNRSSLIYARSIMVKCIGKIALDAIPGVNADLPELDFNEGIYGEQGLNIKRDDNYLHLTDKLVSSNGVALALRSPVETFPDNLWPLEFSDGHEGFKRVYNADGSFNPSFLGRDEPDVTIEEPEDNAPSYKPKR